MINLFGSAGIFIQDLFNGTKILKTKQFLEETKYWSDEKILAYRNIKLKRLLDYSYANVPYYTSLFRQNNLKPPDIKDITEINKLPVLDKEIARQEKERLYSNTGISGIRKRKTGGTTGVSLVYYKDSISKSFSWGAYYRWYNWMGIKLGDPVVVIWGSSTVLTDSKLMNFRKNLIDLSQNIFWINSFSLNDSTLPHYIDKIIKFRPKLIRGYLSGIIQLARYIEENNIKGLSPVAVSTTSETVLPHLRKYIEDVFGAPLYDQYGCGEVSSIAFECAEHNGLHINHEHVIVEVLDDNDNHVFDKPGRLVVTDLDNYAMPFIRYQNGDTVVYSTEQCTCGVNQPLLTQISGRTADTIILKDGSKVHGVFFTDILYELQKEEVEINIKRFQAYQEKQGDIEFRIETKEVLPDSYLSALEKALSRFFNSVSIRLFPELENDASGKFRYVKSAVQ